MKEQEGTYLKRICPPQKKPKTPTLNMRVQEEQQ